MQLFLPVELPAPEQDILIIRAIFMFTFLTSSESSMYTIELCFNNVLPMLYV